MIKWMAMDGEAARLVESAAGLAADLRRILAGEAPTAVELETAPLLDGWTPGSVLSPVMVGSVYGHPILGTRNLAHTSALYAFDLERGWARTWSRFYRLGASADERTTGGHG